MLDKFTENYCIFTVWLLFCSTSPFEIFAMCFFSGPECILKCCSMFARNFDLQSFQKIFNHYWQILNYKKVYLKKEKKNDYWREEDCVGDAYLTEDLCRYTSLKMFNLKRVQIVAMNNLLFLLDDK